MQLHSSLSATTNEDYVEIPPGSNQRMHADSASPSSTLQWVNSTRAITNPPPRVQGLVDRFRELSDSVTSAIGETKTEATSVLADAFSDDETDSIISAHQLALCEQSCERVHTPSREDMALPSEPSFVSQILQYAISVIRDASALVHRPLSLIITFVILGLLATPIFTHTAQYISNGVCIVTHSLCSNEDSTNATSVFIVTVNETVQHTDWVSLIDVQSAQLGELLSADVGGIALSYEIKKAEMATQDLITLLEFSDIQGKDKLVGLLTSFVDDAQIAGEGLAALSSAVGGAIDMVMAVNEQALYAIDAARSSEPSTLMRIVRSYTPWPVKPSEDQILRLFIDVMDSTQEELTNLILQTECELNNLYILEQDLRIIHIATVQSSISVSDREDELLSIIWTHLGANKKELKNLAKNAELLKDLGKYRQEALDRVQVTLMTARQLQKDMQDIRMRASRPRFAGTSIPLETQIRYIKAGIQKIQEERIGAKHRDRAKVRAIRTN